MNSQVKFELSEVKIKMLVPDADVPGCHSCDCMTCLGVNALMSVECGNMAIGKQRSVYTSCS